jgi:serine/threonine protein kinase
MSYLTSKGIVHRDLGARNVLIDSFHNVKVADFGLAKATFAIDSSSDQMPIRYSAPEVLLDAKYSEKSDVWRYLYFFFF